MRQRRPAQRGVRRGTDERGAAPVLRKCGWSVMETDTSELVTLAEKQPRKLGVAQECRIREYGIEDGLQFSGRTADDFKHVGRRRLLPPRLGELAGTRLKLLLQLARVRLELLFRRSLGFLHRVKMTHVGRPRARIRGSEIIPR